MLETVKSLSSIILPCLTFTLSLVTYIRSERKIMRKEREERMENEQSKAQQRDGFPPRKSRL
jgi:hypothetical protein